jgi:hypothetical protein
MLFAADTRHFLLHVCQLHLQAMTAAAANGGALRLPVHRGHMLSNRSTGYVYVATVVCVSDKVWVRT